MAAAAAAVDRVSAAWATCQAAGAADKAPCCDACSTAHGRCGQAADGTDLVLGVFDHHACHADELQEPTLRTWRLLRRLERAAGWQGLWLQPPRKMYHRSHLTPRQCTMAPMLLMFMCCGVKSFAS